MSPPSLWLSDLSLLPRGSALGRWLQLFVSSDFPLELQRAVLPGLQCAGSPFPTAPSPAGPQGASAPSPAPAERSSPGSAAPAGGQRGEEEIAVNSEYVERTEQRAGNVKRQQCINSLK